MSLWVCPTHTQPNRKTRSKEGLLKGCQDLNLDCSAAYMFVFGLLGSYYVTIKPRKYVHFFQGLLNSLVIGPSFFFAVGGTSTGSIGLFDNIAQLPGTRCLKQAAGVGKRP